MVYNIHCLKLNFLMLKCLLSPSYCSLLIEWVAVSLKDPESLLGVAMLLRFAVSLSVF